MAEVLAGDASPLETIERLHRAMAEADATTAAALLHADYRGLSLQGVPAQRHVYVETREKAVHDIAALQKQKRRRAPVRRRSQPPQDFTRGACPFRKAGSHFSKAR